jgi:P-type E1-E2 ATPase
MSRASKHGIIVKSGAVLEKINRASVFAFDKTGTLTHGDVVVAKIAPEKNFSKDEILSLAASAEIASSHVLAVSLVKYATSQNTKVLPAKNVREITGDGIFATVKNQKVIVGKIEFLIKNKVKNIPENLAKSLSTAVFISVNNEFAGTIYFADEVRVNARKTISELKESGIKKIAMLTGDRQETAKIIAGKVGVNEIFSELLPADKVKIMRELCGRENSVAFIGDGVNDAPVLAAADVGIAMGARGSTAASESADAVIMLDDLSRVSLLRKISQRTIKVALQSVWSGIALCLILEIIAAVGFIPALLGAGLQELIDVTVIFNALRAHQDK